MVERIGGRRLKKRGGLGKENGYGGLEKGRSKNKDRGIKMKPRPEPALSVENG